MQSIASVPFRFRNDALHIFKRHVIGNRMIGRKDIAAVLLEDGDLRESRLALTAATGRVLKTALHLICMQSPEKI